MIVYTGVMPSNVLLARATLYYTVLYVGDWLTGIEDLVGFTAD